MNLEAGSRLGGYEIIAPLGAGGMGEVYRARDPRIGREVAIKIVPESVVDSPDRLLRFQREAQSAGTLNHPNLLTIHELGMDDGKPFIVSELLDGTTLRERLAGGPVAPRRAIDYATQIAQGLAAAHERGIVHRDLKPENIFVTRDGRVKILDFGLAKVTTAAHGQSTVETLTRQELTDPGMVVGTAGYMSPEQVRGQIVDARSDIFALGAILYEMLSGRRAFHASSSIDTLHAILHSDPPELSATSAQIPPALERIVNHCLEKDPEQRFQSARDLAFDLGSISGSSSELIAPERRAMPRAATLFWILAVIAAAVAGWFASRSTTKKVTLPRFRRVTYHSLGMPSAFFTPDQQSIVYSAPSEGHVGTFVSPLESPETRSINLRDSTLCSVSRRGELAILLDSRFIGGFINVGTLARVPLAGGSPRELLANVQWADWLPSGDDLLILRAVSGKSRLELPAGNVIYEIEGWIGTPRVSPDGRSIAFLEHPQAGDDSGYVVWLDSQRKKHTLTPSFNSASGIAWRPDGKEVFFTASEEGNTRQLHRVTLAGEMSLVVSSPGTLTLHDIARDGRLLVSQTSVQMKLFARGPADSRDRELSWLDRSVLRDMSPDGQRILFDESGTAVGTKYGVYMRNIDGSPAVRLGDGLAGTFSPDGTEVVAVRFDDRLAQLFLYPTGPGSSRQLTHDALNHGSPVWMPDGRAVVFRGGPAGSPARLYLQPVDGGAPRPITPPGIAGNPFVSPDGRWAFIRGPDGIGTLYPINGGAEVKVPEMTLGTLPVGWSPDSKSFVYTKRGVNPAPVFRLDLATRKSQPIREISTPEMIFGVNNMRFSRDGKTYAYCLLVGTADLYLLENVK